MIARLFILCSLLLTPVSGLSGPDGNRLAAARQAFEQMLRAGTGEATEAQIATAEAAIQAALQAGDQPGECEAMLATVYGFQLTRHPWKVLWLGPKVRALYRSALRREPDNPRVQDLAGTGLMRAPERFRDLAEAERLLRRAENLYEQAGDTTGRVKIRQKLDELAAMKTKQESE